MTDLDLDLDRIERDAKAARDCYGGGAPYERYLQWAGKPANALALVAAFRRASAAYSEARLDQSIANNLARQELAKREAAEAEAARLRAVVEAVAHDDGRRDTVHPGNAFEHFGRLNQERIRLRDMARAALEAK